MQSMYNPSCAWSAGNFPAQRPTGSSGGSWCGILLFVFLLAVGLWWICSSPVKQPLLVEEVVAEGSSPRQRTLPFYGNSSNPAYGSSHGAAGGDVACSDPGVVPSQTRANAGGATAPLDVGPPRVSSIGGLNLPGSSAAGTALSGAFEMTDAGKEYLAAYNPTGLASVMPAGWRADAAAGKDCSKSGGAEAYAEFSRYSISPEAVARSENMRSVLRLSENTRQGMGRTLGYQSLLRNYVTPVGPQPIGDKSMLFNDSSVRQSYIASVTGSFPDLGLC